MIRAPRLISLSTKKRRFSNIFSKINTVPWAWVATASAMEVRSAGKEGQGPSSIFGICDPTSSRITRSWPDSDEVRGIDFLDHHLALCDRAEPYEARHLDVIRANPPFPAVEALDALDPEDVRADPGDPGTQRVQEVAEILDVGLTGGISDHGLAAGEDRGHDRVLGPCHRRLVEEEVRALEPGRRLHPEPPVRVDLGAEAFECVDVRVNTPPTDDVSARGRNDGLSLACKERSGEQDRGPNSAAELLVELVLRDRGGTDPDASVNRCL